jgi:hypothetical protein
MLILTVHRARQTSTSCLVAMAIDTDALIGR